MHVGLFVLYRRRRDQRIVTANQTQRERLTEVMQSIHQRGWCDGTGGNFSMVLQHQPLQLLMAPSGVDKGKVRPDQLIVVDDACAVINGEGKASAETELEKRLYKNGPTSVMRSGPPKFINKTPILSI